MLFARKNVHLGYMSPPGQTLRALNHSFFQRKRRPRSSDGHKTINFRWETDTLVTIGPKGLTSRALNHSFSMLTAYIVAMGSHMADFMALNMLKSYGVSHSSLRAELPPCNCDHIGSRLPPWISDSLIVLSPNLPCTLFVIAFYPESSTLIPSIQVCIHPCMHLPIHLSSDASIHSFHSFYYHYLYSRLISCCDFAETIWCMPAFRHPAEIR